MILGIILILFALGLLVYLHRSKLSAARKKVLSITGKVARAGEISGKDNIPLTKQIEIYANSDYNYERQSIDSADFEYMVISGDSMSPLGLSSDMVVMVSPVSPNQADRSLPNLKVGSVLIFKIDPVRCEKEGHMIKEGFKAREFVGNINLGQANDEIEKAVELLDPKNMKLPGNSEKLVAKLEKARKYFGSVPNITLSHTYKNNGTELDYSIHSFSEIYGIVMYALPQEVVKSVA